MSETDLKTRRPFLGIGVFVIKEDVGKILIGYRGPACKRGAGNYSLPGGMCDPGEAVFDAAYREVREEAGIIVSPGEIWTASDWLPKYDIISFWMISRWKAGVPIETEPGKMQNWRWMSYEEIKADILNPSSLKGEQRDWIPPDLFLEFFQEHIWEVR